MTAFGKRGAPQMRGRADMGADAALWIESTALGGPNRYGVIWAVRPDLTDPDVYGGSGSPGKKDPTAAPWPAMAGVRWYGVPGCETANGRFVDGQELTASSLEWISTFGKGSRGAADGGGALERERTRG